jgi:hypothetical protein
MKSLTSGFDRRLEGGFDEGFNGRYSMAKTRSSTGTDGALIRVSDVIEEPWMEGTYPESVMTRDDDAIFGEWWCKRKSVCGLSFPTAV